MSYPSLGVKAGTRPSPTGASSTFAGGDERETMQGLNSRLASYLKTVQSLEQANSKLELQIHEALEKRGPAANDYSHYDARLEDLRKQISGMIWGNENLTVRINMLNYEAGDFQTKTEIERRFRQSIESDIAGFRNFLDSLHVVRMKLESDIETLSEDLILLKKSHEEEVLDLRILTDQSQIRVDVDGPKGEDLGTIIAEIRGKFEKMALKSQEELKAVHVVKASEVEAKVAENTTALQEVLTERKEKHRLIPCLEIEHQSLRQLTASLEGSLQDTELRYSREMEKHNNTILQLESELRELRANIQHHTQEFDMLLSLKTELEAEIATYRGLLDGEDEFKLEDALE